MRRRCRGSGRPGRGVCWRRGDRGCAGPGDREPLCAGAGAEIARAPDLLLDLNTVPPSVLETLPHVGQSLVKQIVVARERQPITSLDDAGSRIRGLGPSTLAQIAPYLRFERSAQSSLADSGNAHVVPRATKSRSTGKKARQSRKPKLAQSSRDLLHRRRTPGRSDAGTVFPVRIAGIPFEVRLKSGRAAVKNGRNASRLRVVRPVVGPYNAESSWRAR